MKGILELRDRIEAGEDFERLARLYSVDYASGSAGGDIGWQNPGAVVREYQAATDELEINELSLPVRSQFGWHIVKVTGRRDHDMTEDAMRAKAMDYLHNRKYQEELDAWLRQIRDEAFVDIK